MENNNYTQILETQLKVIRQARQNLFANIVREETVVREWTETNPFSATGSLYTTTEYTETETTTEPDTETRKVARQQLNDIIKNSEWFTLRYAAYKGFVSSLKEIETDLISWLRLLNEQLQNNETKEKAEIDLNELINQLYYCDMCLLRKRQKYLNLFAIERILTSPRYLELKAQNKKDTINTILTYAVIIVIAIIIIGALIYGGIHLCHYISEQARWRNY